MDNTLTKMEFTPVKMPLKDVVSEYEIEITKDDLTLMDSIKTVLESGVDKLTLKISKRSGDIIVNDECFKSISCNCVKVKKISDAGNFPGTKTEAKLQIETSSWHFPCPDYKYSNIKRNLEKAIEEVMHINEVEVKSFSTGIVEYDEH